MKKNKSFSEKFLRMSICRKWSNYEFRTFVTLDVTTPDIYAQFTIQLLISNHGNVSFTWDSNEAVTWQCNMTHDLMEVDVNCSGGSWT